MSTEPIPPGPPGAGAPLIPPLPSKAGKGRKRPTDLRWLLWLGAFVLGIGLGIAAYQWVPAVDDLFDYWVALALG
jgi:hypothetical protein